MEKLLHFAPIDFAIIAVLVVVFYAWSVRKKHVDGFMEQRKKRRNGDA